MPFSWQIQIFVCAIGALLLFAVIKAMIRKKITELHGIFWVIVSIAVIVIGALPQLLTLLQKYIFHTSEGSEPYLLFMIICFAFLVVIFLCTKWISQLTARVHELAMQVSLLNQENERIMRRLAEMNDVHKTEL